MVSWMGERREPRSGKSIAIAVGVGDWFVRRPAMYSLKLLGAFRLTAPDGRRIEVRSKRSIALLGLLATSETGERTRSWIQDKLWGSRELRQAQSSLRRELHTLKRLTEGHGIDLLQADARVVRLNLADVEIDIRNGEGHASSAEFLEGIDIAGADEFEDWLRHMRHNIPEFVARAKSPLPLPQAPEASPVVNPSAAGPGLSLAVLPLEAAKLNGNAELAEDAARIIVEALTRQKWLPVVIPHSLVADKAKASKADARPGNPNARYALHGEIGARSTGIRIILTLLEIEQSRLLWTGSAHVEADTDEAALTLELHRLVVGLTHAIGQAEVHLALSRDPQDLDVASLCSRARFHLYKFDAVSLQKARTYIEMAASRNPYLLEVVAVEAVHDMFSTLLAGEYTEERQERLRSLTLRLINADPTDSRGFVLTSFTKLMFGDIELSLGNAKTAVMLNPSSTIARAQLGCAYLFADRPGEAIEELEYASKLTPLDWRRNQTLLILATAYSMLGRLGEALNTCEEAMQQGGHGSPLAYLIKMHILVQQEQPAAAARLFPKFFGAQGERLLTLIEKSHLRHTTVLKRLIRSLEQARSEAEEMAPARERGSRQGSL